ncbi:MAG: MAPEG family protein [Emcibacteraceae bacterium]|nr:MAPEG family protein [Emcibacteraceae bacterium]
MELVAAVILLALLQYIYFAVLVGKARDKYDVKAPATTGHEIFERYLRVQMNTMELLIVLIPSIMIFAFYIDHRAAALFGGVFIVGRMIFLKSYVDDPSTRTMGFAFSIIPCLILSIGGLLGAFSKAFMNV